MKLYLDRILIFLSICRHHHSAERADDPLLPGVSGDGASVDLAASYLIVVYRSRSLLDQVSCPLNSINFLSTNHL